MVEKDEQDNRKIVITQNFLNALDYLIDSGKLKNVAEFERITGYRQQRITGMRKFLSDLKEGHENIEKRYYASTDHLAMMHEEFNVSLNYLLTGKTPIVIESKENQNGKHPPEFSQWKEMIEQKISMLNEKVMLLNEKFEFYKERNKGEM